jgi:hypothetical protein
MRAPWRERILPNDEAERAFGVRPDRCPFCGNPDAGLYLGPTPHVACGACGADGPSGEGRDDLPDRQRQAIMKWNARVTRS